MANKGFIYLSLVRRSLTLPATRICSIHTSGENASTSGGRRPSRLHFTNNRRIKGVPADRGGASIDDLVVPKSVTPSRYTMTGGEEIAKGLDTDTISLVLDEFSRRPMVRELAAENGITPKLYMEAYKSFRKHCLDDLVALEPALLLVFHDIVKDGHDVDRLFSFFLSHARKVFPHLEAIDELRMISDLTQPHTWYPDARTIQRKIIFHAGPTNSGKTYHALKRFNEAKSGIYCGPLKLLAAEVFTRSNQLGLNCDMVTGEERRFAISNHHPSAHLSSTVEMLSTQMRVEVAVIDEIQMLRDEQRGWAFTRALLGVAADEVHLCGESAAIPLVQKLLEPIGEHVEVRHYERKTPLAIASEGLGSLDKIEPGDCIVCFSRKSIYSMSRSLDNYGIKPAIIYGDLPPGTKLAQASKFNDPNDPCNVLVSTDAIGMGLNLNIKRIIFHSLTRQGELLPVHSALQIAGRAGRFGTSYANGFATTLRKEDIGVLKEILSQPVEPITFAGISPTFEQIETFSFHLPEASFVHLLDLFISVVSLSEHFFICSSIKDMKDMAELIDYIPLPLKVRYTFCTVPMKIDNKLNAAAFVKMARRFSSGQTLSYDWMMDMLNWPPEPPKTLMDLAYLEKVYEIFDAYLWLSLRFPDMLPDELEAREARREIDTMIQIGIENILSLVERDAKTDRKSYEARPQKQDGKEINRSKGEQKNLKLPDKRVGKRKTVLETLADRVGLTPEEIANLKDELRDDTK